MADGITFGWEKLADLLEEPGLYEMLADHWEEIAEDRDEIPLEIDWPHHLSLNESGLLRIWVCRKGGQLIGYCCWYIDKHPNYPVLYAWASPFYLDPEYRKGLLGYRLLASAEPELKAMGVKRLVIREKVGGPLGPLFERMTYRAYERAWTKVL